MNIYKTAVYSALSLSILAVVSVLVILSDTLIGIDIILTIAYLILFAIITSVLFYSFKAIASDKSSLNNTLKMVGSFLVLFIICFLISSREKSNMLEIDGKFLSRSINDGFRNIFDGSFLRLKNINIGYTFDFSGGKNMRLYFSGQNFRKVNKKLILDTLVPA